MRINTNMAAMNAWKAMESNQTNLQSSLERLSSGFRINKAADDAAGLAVSEKLQAQMRGMSMATRNTQDAVSMVQTAEGGASKVQDMLQRMRELAVQSGSDTLQDTDRAQLQEEFSSLLNEIDRTAGSVQFNGRKLLNNESSQAKLNSGSGVTELSANGLDMSKVTSGTVVTLTVGGSAGAYTVTGNNGATFSVANVASQTWATVTGTGDWAGISFRVTATANNATLKLQDGLSFQVGANSGETIGTGLGDLTAANMGVSGLSIGSKSNATSAITALDSAVSFVSTQRAKMGAMQNRLENTISTLQTQSENITAADSRIRDVDMAEEMATFTRFQVLSQASTAMLAQANQLPQGILSLLR